MIGLGLSPSLRFDVVCLALVGYLTLTILTLVKLHVFRVMQITYNGIGPTEIRILIGLGILIALLITPPVFATPVGRISVFDAMALLVVVFAFATGIMAFFRDVKHLAELDPPPAPRGTELYYFERLSQHGVRGLAG